MKFSFAMRRRINDALPAVALAIVTIISGGLLFHADFKSLLTLAGGIAAVYAFFYKQHLDDTQFFRELFQEFNGRFEQRNKVLNAIRDSDPKIDLDADESDVLMDYFNLCAEEYLYFKSGFIDPEVWHSWVAGMRYFAESPKIRSAWEQELSRQGNAYYGFDLGVLDQLPTEIRDE